MTPASDLRGPNWTPHPLRASLERQMRQLPTGTVTFLFSDIEGSTRLLDELGAERYAEALAEHRRLMRAAFAAHGGVEVDTQGDAFFVAFSEANGALRAAEQAQAALAEGPVRVRMGIHSGEPLLAEEGYVGIDVHRGARVMSAGHGGQVLVSQATYALLDGAEALTELGRHRLKDLTEPQPLYQLGDGEFPPLKTLYQSNMPVQPTPLVGRETELADVLELLSASRLVTLTGAGGSGKTRLALQAAAELVDDYKDGVWWVSLAALRDPALVEPTIAQVVGAKDGLAEHLRDKEALLLLDNLEQLLEAAPALSELLTEAPDVRVLATSRERLGLRAEQEYPVPTLVPHEAAALFIARARQLKPGFAPDEHVAEICRRLDGLPLALELAATRVKVLSAEQILERLAKSLDLLTTGARDAPERQQTLRATIDWSYELLSPEEQRVFARLSVFASGCTHEAAAEVGEADLDTLQSLVEKSLLRLTNDRFWMLETIREYAAEQLDDTTTEALRDSHSRWYAERSASISRRIRLYDADAMAESDDELANVRVGLARAVKRSDAELLGLYLFGIWFPWLVRGRGREACVAVDRWLECDRESMDTLARWGALLGASEIFHYTGELGRARDLKLEAIELARAQPESTFYDWPVGTFIAATLSDISTLDVEEGRLDDALPRAEEALALRIAEGSPRGIAHAQAALADVHLARGNLPLALKLGSDAASTSRAAGVKGDAVSSDLGAAVVEIELGLVDAARGRVAGVLEELSKLGDVTALAFALETASVIAARRTPRDRSAARWRCRPSGR